MVGKCKKDSLLIKKVAEIYEWLDLQVNNNRDLAGVCSACGKCCDFEGFGHKLFITPPELFFLKVNLGGESLKLMKAGRCPYSTGGRCGVYEHRFAGCRIFCCKGDLDFQNELSEKALKKLKALCEQFQIPYRYADLATALRE